MEEDAWKGGFPQGHGLHWYSKGVRRKNLQHCVSRECVKAESSLHHRCSASGRDWRYSRLSEKKKPVLETGKRKTAIARAVVKSGKGRIYFNDHSLDFVSPEVVRMKIQEPLIIAGERAKGVDIRVSVNGGGFMGQAEAARIAIARSLASWTKSSELRKNFIAFDRVMLAGDQRVTEPKKFGGPSARRRKQKSYR